MSDLNPETSAVLTLTLGILGSSVLPIAWAFSQTSLLLGTLTALVVAFVNQHTGSLLVDAAAFTRSATYESLAFAVGGPVCKFLARISLIILLFGTLCGDFALLADMSTLALEDLFPPPPPPLPPPLPDQEENQHHLSTITKVRIILIFLAITFVLPLSCSRYIRQLEKAAVVGLSLVLVLIIVVCWESAAAGFPALRSGEFPIFFLSNSSSSSSSSTLFQAIAIFSFAFYTHPMILPLLSEMPHTINNKEDGEGEQRRGNPPPIPSLSSYHSTTTTTTTTTITGAIITKRALRIVTLGIAMIVYCTVGIAGAARYGLSTQGDILMNTWLHSLPLEGILGICMALYIALSMAPFVMTLRYQLDTLFHLDEHDYYCGRYYYSNSNSGEEDGLILQGTTIENHQHHQQQQQQHDSDTTSSNNTNKEGMFINRREIALTVVTLSSALAVALKYPTESEQMFAVTGATGVTFVCYLFPIYAHFRLYFRKNKTLLLRRRSGGGGGGEEEEMTAALLPDDNNNNEEEVEEECYYPRFSDLIGKSVVERGVGLLEHVLKPGLMVIVAMVAMTMALLGQRA